MEPGPPPLRFHSHPSTAVRRHSNADNIPPSVHPTWAQPSSARYHQGTIYPPSRPSLLSSAPAMQQTYQNHHQLSETGPSFSHPGYGYAHGQPAPPSYPSNAPSQLNPDPAPIQQHTFYGCDVHGSGTPTLGSIVTDSKGEPYSIVRVDVVSGQVTLRKIHPPHPSAVAIPPFSEPTRPQQPYQAPPMDGQSLSRTGLTSKPRTQRKRSPPPPLRIASSIPNQTMATNTPFTGMQPAFTSAFTAFNPFSAAPLPVQAPMSGFQAPTASGQATIDPRYLYSQSQLQAHPAQNFQWHNQNSQQAPQPNSAPPVHPSQPVHPPQLLRHPLLMEYYQLLAEQLPHLSPESLLEMTRESMVHLLAARGNGIDPEAWLRDNIGLSGGSHEVPETRETMEHHNLQGEMNRLGATVNRPAWTTSPLRGRGMEMVVGGRKREVNEGLQLDLGLPPIPTSLLNSSVNATGTSASGPSVDIMQPPRQTALPTIGTSIEAPRRNSKTHAPFLAEILRAPADEGTAGSVEAPKVGKGRKQSMEALKCDGDKVVQVPKVRKSRSSNSQAQPAPQKTPTSARTSRPEPELPPLPPGPHMRRSSSNGSNVIAGFLRGVGPYTTRAREMKWEEGGSGSPLKSVLDLPELEGLKDIPSDEIDELAEVQDDRLSGSGIFKKSSEPAVVRKRKALEVVIEHGKRRRIDADDQQTTVKVEPVSPPLSSGEVGWRSEG